MTIYKPHLKNLRIGMIYGSPDASSSLQLDDTTTGFLANRLTTSQISAVSTPATGLFVYNTTTGFFNFYNGTAWQAISSSSSSTGGVRLVASGTTDTVLATDTFIGWNSSTTSAKAESISAGTFAGQTVIIKDAIGTAGTYNITVTASGCTIDGQATKVMSNNLESIGLKWDGVSNWMVF